MDVRALINRGGYKAKINGDVGRLPFSKKDLEILVESQMKQ